MMKTIITSLFILLIWGGNYSFGYGKNRSRYQNNIQDITLSFGGGYQYSKPGGFNFISEFRHKVGGTSLGYGIGFQYNRDKYYNIITRNNFFRKPVYAKDIYSLNFDIYYSLREVFNKYIGSQKFMGSPLDVGFLLGPTLHYQNLRPLINNMLSQGINNPREYPTLKEADGFLIGINLITSVSYYIHEQVAFFGNLRFDWIISGINDEQKVAQSLNRTITPFFQAGISIKL